MERFRFQWSYDSRPFPSAREWQPVVAVDQAALAGASVSSRRYHSDAHEEVDMGDDLADDGTPVRH